MQEFLEFGIPTPDATPPHPLSPLASTLLLQLPHDLLRVSGCGSLGAQAPRAYIAFRALRP